MTEPIPMRVPEKPCCADCENPVHDFLRRAKPVLTDEQYQKFLRALRKDGLLP